MSYFAGGLRFHEQLYAVVGAQTHIALLGISVAAILLPEAYHLAYPTTTETTDNNQFTNRASTNLSPGELRDILSMSRGLSFILLIVYALYLTFQLYTHAYLFSVDREQENHDDLPEPNHHKVFPKPNWVPSLRTVMSRDTFSHHGRNTPTPPRPFMPSTDADGDIGGFNTHTRSASHVDLEQQRQATSHSVSSYLASQAALQRGDVRQREKRAGDEKRGSESESQPSPIEAGRQSPESMQFPATTVDIIDIERQRIKRKVIPKPKPKVPTYYAFASLLVFSGLAGVTAECLVASIDGLTENTGVSREFIGMIVLPVVGNAVEHITAVTVSLKDRLNLSLSIAVGSSVQVSLGLVPLLVLIGWMIGQPMSLLFDTFETICLVLAVIIVNAAIADGRTNFLEGAVLMMTWVCMAIVTWYYDPLH
jgi:Ca2+:H+ antiporter